MRRRDQGEQRRIFRPGLALVALGVMALLAGTTLGSSRPSGWTKEGEIASVPDVLYLEQAQAKVATIARINRSIATEVDVDDVAQHSPAEARRGARTAPSTTAAPAIDQSGGNGNDKGNANGNGGGSAGGDGSADGGTGNGSPAGSNSGNGSGSNGGDGGGSHGRTDPTTTTTTVVTTTTIESPTTTDPKTNKGRTSDKTKSTSTGGTADTTIPDAEAQ